MSTTVSCVSSCVTGSAARVTVASPTAVITNDHLLFKLVHSMLVDVNISMFAVQRETAVEKGWQEGSSTAILLTFVTCTNLNLCTFFKHGDSDHHYCTALQSSGNVWSWKMLLMGSPATLVPAGYTDNLAIQRFVSHIIPMQEMTCIQ